MPDSPDILSFRKFYWECTKRAFRGKILWVEGISGLFTLASVPLGIFWDVPEGAMNWVPLVIFGFVFVGAIVFGLVRAPHAIYRDEAGKAYVALKALEPKLDLQFLDKPPFVYERQVSGQQIAHGVCIRIENLSGTETIENVELHLAEIEGTHRDFLQATFKPVIVDSPVNLSPGQSVFFDVLVWIGPSTPGKRARLEEDYVRRHPNASAFNFEDARFDGQGREWINPIRLFLKEQKIDKSLPFGSYGLVLVAHGRNTAPTSLVLKIERVRGWRLKFSAEMH